MIEKAALTPQTVAPVNVPPDPNYCQEATCPTREPEPHLLGEFPMTCYRCHMEADA